MPVANHFLPSTRPRADWAAFAKWVKIRGSQIRYRVGGLPISLMYLRHPSTRRPEDILRHSYARRYWRVRDVNEVFDLTVAILFLPFLVIGAAVWHTARSTLQARKTSRSFLLQLLDQLRIYVGSGVMPATYYIFSLAEKPTVRHARSYLKRAETKGLIYHLIKERMPPSSSLNDKAAFEARCRSGGLPVVPTIAIARDGELFGTSNLPERDLFIKPVDGKGGRGAERWEWMGSGGFRSADGQEVTTAELRELILRRSHRSTLIIQPRIANHHSLKSLNCGALATIRVLTCLNEDGEPEIIGAAFRMPMRPGSIVDNLHAGGITAAVDPETGKLGRATNLGKDGRVGWLDNHPVTGATIAGRELQWWSDVVELALRAHRDFNDRLFVGWDIAVSENGPILIEGNGAPDLDILQRSSRSGMIEGRFTELLAERLNDWRACGCRAAQAAVSIPSSPSFR